MDKHFIARPYAKAIFDLAVESNNLQQWSNFLSDLTIVLQDKIFTNFVHNPLLNYEQLTNLFITVADKSLGTVGRNFIQVLAKHRRLDIFLELASIYEELCFEYEQIARIKVISAYELTVEQRQKLELALQKRLQKKIVLEYGINKTLLGGLVIYMGDNVIDSSLRNKLNKTKQNLLHISK